MLRYGTDKPDLRYGIEIAEMSDAFSHSELPGLPAAQWRANGVVRALRAPGGAALGRERPRSTELTELAKENGAKGMAYVYVEEGRALRGPIVKFLSAAEQVAGGRQHFKPSPATW